MQPLPLLYLCRRLKASRIVLEALSCGVPVVVTRSTKFFDELEKLNFGAAELRLRDNAANR